MSTTKAFAFRVCCDVFTSDITAACTLICVSSNYMIENMSIDIEYTCKALHLCALLL